MKTYLNIYSTCILATLSNLWDSFLFLKGMPVIFTHNYDVFGEVVNGSEGIVRKVNYTKMVATSCVVFVEDSSFPSLSF